MTRKKYNNTFKVGMAVEVLPNRTYNSVNIDNSIGIIRKIDFKNPWCVKVEVPFTDSDGNWENVKFLKQL